MVVILEVSGDGVKRARIPFREFREIADNADLLEKIVSGIEALDRSMQDDFRSSRTV